MKNLKKENENYTGFLEDLEEDPDYRKNVNIYVGSWLFLIFYTPVKK